MYICRNSGSPQEAAMSCECAAEDTVSDPMQGGWIFFI